MQGVQVAVELAPCNHFGEVADFFSQYLFGNTFVVGLVCIKLIDEVIGQEEGHAKGAFVHDGHVEIVKWGLTWGDL